ncbi:hypothetical protein DPMN_093854 [Dreissena polymorpha]|uniref:Uncharacterized protein n=1 Tax=Dreissena polymorpha TaxID=45954 RepID=A0A9D4L4Z3_DREPO|nr:hypothetical protein DPMN_093854 [Dreissena polymorpha]
MTSEHPGSQVFEQTRTIFLHIQDIFHEDSSGHIRKNAPLPGDHVFQATRTSFKLVQDIGTNLLTKFNDDWTINLGSRVFLSHVFPPTGTIFELVQDIIGTNLVTKFHHDRTINVASRVLISGFIFTATETILKLIQDIIGTNLLTKFHEDRKINLASREKCPAAGCHIFQPTGIIFELVQDIIGMNLFTKFHDMASRVLTRFHYSHIRKNAPPLGSNVFQANCKQATKTIFELVQNIIGTNLLTKFHEDRKINVVSRVLTRKKAPPPGGHVFQLFQDIIGMILLTKFHEDWTKNILLKPYKEKCPAPLQPCFQANVTIFELIQDIIETNLLTKFHEDWTINVASRVLTRKNAQPPDIIGPNLLTKFHKDRKINKASRVLTRNNAPLPGIRVFQPTSIIFELIQDIFGMNILTYYQDFTKAIYSHIRKNAPPLGSHVFQANVTIFELIQDIIESNLLTKFHEDWTINVAFRVLTRKNAPPHHFRTRKKALPLGSHVFQANVTIFKLIQDIFETNLLTKFHEDWTINVVFRELTRQMLTPHNGRRTKGDHKSSP